MWDQYRRTFVLTQLFILVIVALLIFMAKAGRLNALLAFLFMQIAALVGAWWGTRLKRKIEAKREQLPLKGK